MAPNRSSRTDHLDSPKKPEGYIYLWLYQSLLLFRSVQAHMHQHYPIEIYIGLEGDFQMDFGSGWGTYRSVIIETDQLHRFDGSSGWCALLMIDPITKMGDNFRKMILQGNRYAALDPRPLEPFMNVLRGYRTGALPCGEVELVFNEMLRAVSQDTETPEPMNPRMIEILKILRGLPEKKITAANLAEITHLSESRLAHVFKNGTGMPVRRFLLWLRLIDAVKLIINGMPYSDAAHEAGFADHAHLTRTYKKMFGLTLSHVLNEFNNVEVITYF